jgi:hypothetical protein
MRGLTLYPRQSLVLNAGFDGSGTHEAASMSLKYTNIKAKYIPTVLPDTIIENIAWNGLSHKLGNLQTQSNSFKIAIRKILKTFTRLWALR